MEVEQTKIQRKNSTKNSFDISPDSPLDGHFTKVTAPDSGLPLCLLRFGESVRFDSNWFKHVNYHSMALEMILEGEMEYLSEGTRHVVKQGELFLITPGSNVRFVRTPDSDSIRKLHLICAGPLAGILLYTLGFRQDSHIKPETPETTEAKMRSIGRSLEENTPESLRRGSAELYKLLLDLAACSDLKLLPEKQKLQGLIRFQERQPKIPVPNSELEKTLARGHSTLNELYKNNVGMPPHRYHLTQRLNMAAQLLSTTDMLIKDIAAECGFSNDKYFLVIFKKKFGLTPGNFRSSRQSPSRSSD